jgi:hypothetical protein
MTAGQRRLIIAGGVALGVVATVLLAARDSLQVGHGALVLAALAMSLAVYLLWGILAPLVGLEGAGTLAITEAQRVRLELLRVKDTVVESLRELEFDRATGKVGVAEYEPMRQELEVQAIRAMKALDEEQAHWEKKIEGEVRKELEARGVKVAAAPAAAAVAAPAPRALVPAPPPETAPGPPPASAPAAAPPAASAAAPAAAPEAAEEGDVFRKIEKLSELMKKGAITPEDFERKKQELLARI